MLRRGNKSLILWQGAQRCHLPIWVILLGFIVAVTFLFTRNSGVDGDAVIEKRTHNHVSELVESQVVANPTVEFINGTEVIWQIPTDPKAVLFVAHGCSGSALNFWDSCTTCPKCVGLPEEKRIVLDALARKYAVLTISSADVCWSYGKERLRVKDIIRRWSEHNGLVKIPLVGLGASSGGYFLSALATEVRFKGIVLMIASGLFDRMDNFPENYSPTLFVHMPKDVKRRRKIDRHIGILRKKGVEAQEIKCLAFPLAPNWLADRIQGVDQTTSSKLFKLFHDKGFIDERGYMKNDGRKTPWREAVEESSIRLPYGSKLMHHIQEELNLAYAYHEMTSLQTVQIFEWLESHIR